MAEISAYPLLRRCHLFISMSDDELKELATHFVMVTVEAEAYVFRQGEAADGFYFIHSGQASVEQINPLNNQLRHLATFVEGDYFGEMALVRRGLRSASIKALKPLTLFKLTNQEFDQFLANNPKVKPNLEVALRSRQYARQANFKKWLAPNESVYIVTLRHPLFLLEMLLRPAAVVLGAFGLAGVIYYINLPLNFQLASLAVLLAGLGWAWWNWVDFHNDWYVVTNQRVVDIDKVLLFYDSRSEAPLSTVQNTTIKTNELGRQFGYGDVIINTWSGPVVFHNVPYPQATADMILEQVNRARVQIKTAEREQLKKMLRQSVGIEPAPLKPASSGGPSLLPKPRTTAGLLWSLLKYFSLQVREQQGDTIIYHKHPLVLLQKTAGSLVGILLAIAALALRAAGTPDFIDPWLYGGIVTVVGLGLLIHVLYEYMDWKNDIYMVTGSQIVDLQRKPFGDEQRKAANLDAITNISFVRPGLIYQLLNYGTVTINAGPGGEMKFFDVYDPVMVQQDIYRRKEALSKAKAESATRQRVDELSQYMAAFYEVLEDERKKREGK